MIFWNATLRHATHSCPPLYTSGKYQIMKALFYDKAKEDGDNIVKNDYTLTWSAVLANFLDDVKLCFSLQIPSQCYSLEFFQVVPSGQGSGVLRPQCSLKLLCKHSLGHTVLSSICLHVLQAVPEPLRFAAQRSCRDTLQHHTAAPKKTWRWGSSLQVKSQESTSKHQWVLNRAKCCSLVSDIHKRQFKWGLLCTDVWNSLKPCEAFGPVVHT